MSDEDKSISGKPSSTVAGSENDPGEGLCFSLDVKGAKASSRELINSCDAMRRLRRRISNRESARRLRKQRSEKLSSLVSQQDSLVGLSNGLASQVSALRKRLHRVQAENRSLLLSVGSAKVMELSTTRVPRDETSRMRCKGNHQGDLCCNFQQTVFDQSGFGKTELDEFVEQPLQEELHPSGATPSRNQVELGRTGSMATRSQTSQQARIEVLEAIRELTSPDVAPSAASIAVAHAVKEAALAAAEALCARSDHTVAVEFTETDTMNV